MEEIKRIRKHDCARRGISGTDRSSKVARQGRSEPDDHKQSKGKKKEKKKKNKVCTAPIFNPFFNVKSTDFNAKETKLLAP